MTLFLFTLNSSFAGCELLERYKLGLEAHSLNLANLETTRTLEGGAYKKKTVKCDKRCQVIEKSQFKLRYEPKHPDANSDGYVVYPDITAKEESVAIAAFAKSIHGLSQSCEEEVETVYTGNSLLIKYNASPIKLDILNFDNSDNITSWLREDASGRTKVINF